MTESEWLTSDDPQGMLNALPMLMRCDDEQTPAGPGLSSRKLRLFACAAARLDPLWPSWRKESAPKISLRNMEQFVENGLYDHHFEDGWVRDMGFFWEVRRSDEAARLMAAGTDRMGLAALLRDIVGNPFRPVRLDRKHIEHWIWDMASCAYDEREDKCVRCRGTKKRRVTDMEEYERVRKSGGIVFSPRMRTITCDNCGGSGQDDSGRLHPDRLAVLGDALEEAGCIAEERRQDSMGGFKTVCVPHPLVVHLRSPGPHVRGCWALDLILGKE
jgi:hypothetical protein